METFRQRTIRALVQFETLVTAIRDEISLGQRAWAEEHEDEQTYKELSLFTCEAGLIVVENMLPSRDPDDEPEKVEVRLYLDERFNGGVLNYTEVAITLTNAWDETWHLTASEDHLLTNSFGMICKQLELTPSVTHEIGWEHALHLARTFVRILANLA